jgi:hypothetical protein
VTKATCLLAGILSLNSLFCLHGRCKFTNIKGIYGLFLVTGRQLVLLGQILSQKKVILLISGEDLGGEWGPEVRRSPC